MGVHVVGRRSVGSDGHTFHVLRVFPPKIIEDVKDMADVVYLYSERVIQVLGHI